MQAVAARLGLAGWVRNRRDGTVEALVCGPDDRLQQLIDWARQGPAFASVTQVIIIIIIESNAAANEGFTVLPTD